MTKENQPETCEPAESIVVTNLETLKVVSDALRSRIIDLLRAAPQTVKQLAAALNLPQKKLYYHINLLEQHELIRVVGTRIVSGIIEKTYRATAYLFLFDQEVFASSAEDDSSLPAGKALLFEATKNQLAQSIEDKLVDLEEDVVPQHRLLASWNMARMTPEQAQDFYARLEALIDEFETMQQDQADANIQSYRLFLTLFPVRWQPKPQ
ncbi:MAG: helix-turn-helix domain-containing protein [Caldilineaceae bacterium]